jgi:hypothetical protein
MELDVMADQVTQAVAQAIFDQNIGCRYGTTINGAAYGFMDIAGADEDGGSIIPPMQTVIAWLQNPNAPAFEPRWDNRLWNTCGVIVSLSPAGTVLLVSEATPTAERYKFHSDLGRGDYYSFRKCNLLPPNSAILATIQYGDGQDATANENFGPPPSTTDPTKEDVAALYEKITVALGKIAAI